MCRKELNVPRFSSNKNTADNISAGRYRFFFFLHQAKAVVTPVLQCYDHAIFLKG